MWELLCDGVDCVRPAPTGRFGAAAQGLRGSFINDIDAIDAGFFGFTQREAAAMDPHHRVLLETSYEALEDAGIDPDSISEQPVGVFVGVQSSEFEAQQAAHGALNDVYKLVGSARNAAAGRISHLLKVQGISVALDADRSSSLMAVHLACQSLRCGESTLALAGGASLILDPAVQEAFARAGLLAADGRCKFGDATADGFVRGEGAGMLLLKPLEAALRDGDAIYAVIAGSAAAHAASTDLMTPSQAAQEGLLRAAYKQAQVDPATVGYIEAHGTGTPTGDPIELGALGNVLGRGRADPLWVGSVKTNLGHTEAAGGVAGVIKVALMLKHGAIAPSLHCTHPNPRIPFAQLGVAVPRAVMQWPTDLRRAGVTSLGLTGSAVHVVLEQAPTPPPQPEAAPAGPWLLPVSARDPAALKALAQSYAQTLATAPLPEVCVAAATLRQHWRHRLIVQAETEAAAIAALQAYGRGEPAAGLRAGAEPQPGVVFAFPGQGAHWDGMGRDLLAHEPVFARVIEACDAAIAQLRGWSLMDLIRSAPPQAWTQTVAQAAQFCFAAALTELWRHYGVAPAAVLGVSMSEATAAYVAGALTLEEALQLLCVRGEVMATEGDQHGMLAVALGPDAAREWIGDAPIELAVFNSPNSTVLAGETAALQALASKLAAQGISARSVRVNVASHSRFVAPLVAPLTQQLSGLRPQATTLPIFSAMAGGRIDGATMDATYWGRNLREQARLDLAIAAACGAGYRVFLEVSTHPLLMEPLVDSCAAAQVHPVCAASLRRDMPSRPQLLRGAATLYAAGAPIHWRAVYGPPRRTVELPLYPWQRQRVAMPGAIPHAAAPVAAPAEAVPHREPSATSTAPPSLSVQQLLPLIRAHAAQILGVESPALVDAERPLQEQGLKSVMAVELRSALSDLTGAPLPATLLYDYPSVRALAHHLSGPATVVAATPRQRKSDEPIAVIGMACRFPGGAATPAAFWALLRDGVDAVVETGSSSRHRRAFAGIDPALQPRLGLQWGAFINDVEQFDAAFFNMSAREAERTDPQQRLLLEVAYEALERAGQRQDVLHGSATGVFVGVMNYNEYASLKQRGADITQTTAHDGVGDANSAAAGRLAYEYGLVGPCISLDTACSSSLVAVHLATRSLQRDECSMALVGGVNLILTPEHTVAFSKSGMLAPDGRCKTFDGRANGYVRGEGCGVVVLKLLRDAVAAGDPIVAVIRGSAINQDGRSNGLTAPSGVAQQILLKAALHDAQLQAKDLGYIEAHGTGTPLGDPIEMQAIDAVLGATRVDGPLRVGSVKTNIGHLEAAAGMAGLIKGILMLQNGAIPPHLHFEQLNPHIRVDPKQVRVASQTVEPWDAVGQAPRRLGISSFGFTGTNAHVIVEEAPSTAPSAPEISGAFILPLSARNPETLARVAQETAAYLHQAHDSAVPSLAYTAGVRRSHHRYRLALVGHSRQEWLDALAAYTAHTPNPRWLAGDSRLQEDRGIVLVFSGHGTHWLGMGQELLAHEPAFRRALETCDEALRPHLGWSVRDALQTGAPAERFTDIDAVQPMVFAMQVALAALWETWGVRPAAIVGHSAGEVAAAYVAGALDLVDAAQVICLRSRLMRQVAGRGAMVAVDPSLAPTAAVLHAQADRLCVAVQNSDHSVVMAGNVAAIEALQAELTALQQPCARVKTDVAFHSPHMDSLCAPLEAGLTHLRPRAPRLPLYSSVTGARLEGAFHDAAYWVRNLRQQAKFAAAARHALSDAHRLFLEISPHPVLMTHVSALGGDIKPAPRVVGSLRRERPERESLGISLATLYCEGATVDFSQLHRTPLPVQPLPTYPWLHQRYWVQEDDPAAPHPLLGLAQHLSTGAHVWETQLSLATLPYLADHRVGDAAVMPAAAYIEMMLAAAQVMHGSHPVQLEDVAFSSLLVLESGRLAVQTIVEDDRVHISSLQQGTWQRHAECRIKKTSPSTPSEPARVPQADAESYDASTFYARLASCGLHYGPAFQGVRQAQRSGAMMWGTLRGAAEDHALDPTLLDAALQLAVAHSHAETEPWVPVAMAQVQVHGNAQTCTWATAHATMEQAGTWQGDIKLHDAAGNTVVTVQGLRLQRLGGQVATAQPTLFLAHQWQRLPDATPTGGALTPQDSWLVIGADSGGVARALRQGISGHGGTVVQLSPGPDLAAQLAATLADTTHRWRGVVHGAALDAGKADTLEALHQAAATTCDITLMLVHALTQHGRQSLPKLWLLGTTQPAHGFLWGLGRTLAYEHPELHCCRVQLAETSQEIEREIVAGALLRELLSDGHEDEVALHADGSRHGGRLVRTQVQPRALSQVQTPAGQRPFKLVVDKPGALQDITLRQQERRPPAAGEVEVQMQAAGINFLDVLSALGVIPKAMSPGGDLSLGIEGAGRICAVGSGVKDMHVGQEVIVLAPGCMASHRTVPAATVFPKPQSMPPESAATLLLVHMTAYYALHTIAQLKKGERILIHSAAGGVGLAAIQWAQHVGAEIFVTVGTPEKREAMHKLGITHVSDSRSLSFADDIMKWTHGEGVDVVLNSLAGDAIARSLGVLRDYGRFIEIGKRDYLANASLGMQPFLRNLTFSLVDLLGMSTKRPEAYRALANDVLAKIDQGILHALPHKAYPVAEITQAFRDMSRGQHVGKLALHMRDAETTPIAEAATSATCRADGTYLITGGLGGLGWGLAHWMHQQGAGNVVLVGRHAPSPEQQNSLKELPWAHTRQADVADPKQVRDLLESLKKLPPLRGIIHAAAVLDDGLLAQQTPERFAKVIAPKAWGAWNLHHLTQDMPLDFFVLYSSAVALLGNPGQSNYAAANAFVDALAEHRHTRGLPALSINWGPFADVGMAAGQASRGERLAARGMTPLTPEQGQALLATLMQSDVQQIGALQLDAAAWLRAHPALAQATLFSQLVAPADAARATAQAPTGTLRRRLHDADKSRHGALVEEFLRQQVATLLRLDPAHIKRDAAFKSLGVDSLTALELRNQLEMAIDKQLSPTIVWAYPNIAALGDHLINLLNDAPPAPVTAAGKIEVDEPPTRDLTTLTQDELIAALKQEL